MSPHAPQVSFVNTLGQCRVYCKDFYKDEHNLLILSFKTQALLLFFFFLDSWPEGKSSFHYQT